MPGTHLQQSGRVRAGCSPSGQPPQRAAEQSEGWLWPLVGTQRQQSGGLSAGVCPSGQAAQRTVEQSTFCAAAAESVVAGAGAVPGAMVAVLVLPEAQAQRPRSAKAPSQLPRFFIMVLVLSGRSPDATGIAEVDSVSIHRLMGASAMPGAARRNAGDARARWQVFLPASPEA